MVSTVNKPRKRLQKAAAKSQLTSKNNGLFRVCCCGDDQGLAPGLLRLLVQTPRFRHQTFGAVTCARSYSQVEAE